jgi:hypothetical protein
MRLAPRGNLPRPFRDLELKLHAPYALLSDAWHSADASHVRQRTAGLVPASRLAQANTIWRPLLAPLRLIEPSIVRLCPGLIEPERLPENRLGPGQSPLPGRCP